MTSDEINDAIKRLCLNNRLSSTVLTLAQADAINELAHYLVAAAPEYFEKKVSLANGGTNVFQVPSDCLMLKNAWDYGGNVGTISGAADNGSGLIRITHNIVIPDDLSEMEFPYYFPFGFSSDIDDTVVTIHGVVGCTEANGTWRVVYVDSTHVDLYGSTFSNEYTSGGKIFIEEQDVYDDPLKRIPSQYESAFNDNEFFYREDDIVVNYPSFENDLIILYRYLPDALSEIPARFHQGIYAYGVMNLIDLNDRYVKAGDQYVESADYSTKRKNLEFSQNLWNSTVDKAMAFTPVLNPSNISDRKSIKRWL